MTPHNNPAKDFLLYPSDEPHLKKLRTEVRSLLEQATNYAATYTQIAADHQLPIGTVKSRINRARERVLKMRAAAADQESK